ncbi:MAG: CHAD domain-containing protein [Gemmatimonadota bacterium]
MASFPESILGEPAQRAVRVVALRMLEEAAAQHDRLRTEPSEETLHDFRVAVRRLRSWVRAQQTSLGGGAPRRAHKALRRVARGTNASRDAEVFAQWLDGQRDQLAVKQRVGLAWLRARTEERKLEADARENVRTDAEFTRAARILSERLPEYESRHHVEHGLVGETFAPAMAALIRLHSVQLRRRSDRVIDPASADQAHRARIAGKRLRYLLEPIAGHVPRGDAVLARLKSLQNTLGDLHDAHMWMDQLRAALSELGEAEGRQATLVTTPDSESAEEGSQNNEARPGVTALAQIVRDRARGSFDSFIAEWRGEPAAPFFSDIEGIAEFLERRSASDREIERKYLLYSIPENWPEGDVLFIDQGYLPGERLVERLRHVRTRTGERWVRTIKLGSGVSRTEIEEETTREFFEAMWPLTKGRRVSKRRYRIPGGDLVWEIDEFTDRDLVLAEVELTDANVQPPLPDWLAPFVVREVTGEPEYLNSVLAR